MIIMDRAKTFRAATSYIESNLVNDRQITGPPRPAAIHLHNC